MRYCTHCQFYRAITKEVVTEYDLHCNPTKRETVPTGHGECMLMPPGVAFQQAKAHSRQTWTGTVTSVVNPGFVQQRPEVLDKDFCGQFQAKEEACE